MEKQKKFDELVALFNKTKKAYMDYLINLDVSSDEAEKGDLPGDWFNLSSDELGGVTPHEYAREACGGEITADDAKFLFDSFCSDSFWSAPEGVCELLAQFGEEGIKHIVEILGDKDCLTASYYESTDKEALAAQDRIIAVLGCINYFVCDDVKNAVWTAFKLCIEENEAIIEGAADAIIENFGAGEAVEFLLKAESIGFKELTLMQGITNGEERSDELYKCLRTCVKRSQGNEKLTALSIFADYGDPRAVTLLRSVAKDMKDKLTPGSKNNEAFQELYMVASMINKLGGNTEDIIGM